MGKTDTIKDRRVDVYLDSLERKEEWTELADDADMSLSQFVQSCVAYAIAQGGPDFLETGEAAEEIQNLNKRIQGQKNTLKEKDMVIEKLRTDLKQHRSEPFLDEDFEGRRQFDTELIEVLQGAETIRSEDLFRRLNVDSQNVELIQGIQSQLERLEEYGLVKETVHGWRWIR